MSVAPMNRRRDIRRTLPKLSLRIGGLEFHTRDWSLGGFSLVETGSTFLPYELEDEVAGDFSLEGQTGTFAFRAELVRLSDGTGIAGFRFIDMEPATFTVLERRLMRAEPVATPSSAGAAASPPAGTGNWFVRLASRGRR